MKQFVKSLLTRIYVRQMKQIIAVHNPRVVAVVGSVGKTSTKLAIATVLSEKYRVCFQSGNYNTPISIPFIFFGRPLPSLTNPFGWLAAWNAGRKIIRGEFPYDIVVVELGTDKPGEIAEFQDYIHPDIAVLTAISAEHMEFFGTIDAVAAEEFDIVAYCDKLVLGTDDIDDAYVKKFTAGAKQSILSYGFQGTPTCLITNERQPSGQKLLLEFLTGEKIESSTVLVAKHSLSSAAAAAVVAKELGLDAQAIAAGIEKIKPFAGRMQILKGIKNSIILDDSYNASPLAVEAALRTLYEIEAPQRIALLGNMNELGDASKASHEAIGKLCDSKKLDLVVTLGPDANAILAPVAEAGGCKVIKAQSPYEAGAIIAENIQDGAGAYVLVKGSQNRVFSEEAIKSLLADPSDTSLLVRQSDEWLSKKRKQFPDANI